ncbi:TniQ family protein [Cereibacter azotoformans]|uniref:TniQ family protein n=1 Tax=Cereibacter azotoformans TaxID=43057 RepID=UPI0002F92E56|nr:TniQ family protein [Cereibacter azotoformans]ULB09193.1 TniQ family protein [Cereibacter azotoformans]
MADPRAFLAGAPDAVAILAAAAAVDPEALADSMIRRLDRCREFRGERWTRGFVMPEGTRFCPECLLEDGVEEDEWRGIGRIAWRLRPVLTCHHHHRSLITLADAEAGDDLDHRFPGAAELREMAVETQVQVPTPLETMILDRLAGSRTTGGAWLRCRST